jgi:lipopolysaccharide/colanic/teichoic acid biosynthesis glycosyltransferase
MIYKKALKRPIDFCLSLVAISVLSPVFMGLTFLVRIKLGSPVLFKQERPGLHEKIFTVYKFRTMLQLKNEEGDLLPDELRLTKFGNHLRSSSLDELPELINVLRGDMAIIGPRPLLVKYLPRYNEKQKRRHEVRPGLSGLAQINGRNAISWEEKFDLDIDYVDNVRFSGDIRIILKTIIKVFQREGINNQGENVVEEFRGVK